MSLMPIGEMGRPDKRRAKSAGFTYEYPRPTVTVDIIIFTVTKGELQVLLIKRKNDPFKNCLALPGGFVNENESLEAAAHRELLEETGVGDESGNYLFLEQIAAFGDPGRDPRGHTVSVAYMALVSSDKEIRAGDDATGAFWFRASLLENDGLDLPYTLAFDHQKILEIAIANLRGKLDYINQRFFGPWPLAVGFHLIPKRFTLAQLQGVYEAILGKKLTNFHKKIVESGVVKKVDGPRLFEFRR